MNQLKTEFRRVFSSSGMLLSISIGSVITLLHVFQTPLQLHTLNLNKDFELYPFESPCSAIANWIGADVISLESFLFYMLMPLLATLPFASSFFSDKKSGYLKNIYARSSRKDYLISKYIAVFVSAGIAVIVPLILNLMICMVLLPNTTPEPSAGASAIQPLHLFSMIYYTKPTLYLIIYLIIDFIFAGLFACISLTCSFFTNYKIIVLICPFFVQLILDTFCDLIGKYDWSCTSFLRSGYGIPHLLLLVVYILLGAFGTTIGYYYKGVREDVF